MNKYGLYAYNKTQDERYELFKVGQVDVSGRLIATTDAKDAIEAGLALENFANAMVGEGNWYVTKIEGKVFG